MSFWDSRTQQVITYPDHPWPGYPGWIRRDCHCCAGIRWGGESPVPCDSCHGLGSYAVHRPTGTIALYPGGPLLGAHEPPSAPTPTSPTEARSEPAG